MATERDSLIDEWRDPEARREFADDFLNTFIALQIKTLRQQRGWSQEELATRAGTHQSRISALENVNYSSWSVRTLRQLAEAFDLAVLVGFESFSSLLQQVNGLKREALERASFKDDVALLDSGANRAASHTTTVDVEVAPWARIRPFRPRLQPSSPQLVVIVEPPQHVGASNG